MSRSKAVALINKLAALQPNENPTITTILADCPELARNDWINRYGPASEWSEITDRMPPPLTSRPRTLAAMIQWVMRTTALCRSDCPARLASASMTGSPLIAGAAGAGGCGETEEGLMRMRLPAKNTNFLQKNYAGYRNLPDRLGGPTNEAGRRLSDDISTPVVPH